MVLTDFFISSRNKEEVIVTFMAVLELIRLKEIKVVQNRLFADIEVVRNTENIVSVDDTQESQYNGAADILPENIDSVDKRDQDQNSD